MDAKHFESLYPETTRELEIHQIVEYIREGNSSELIGLPGVGRSNILGLLAYNKAIRLKHFPKTHDYIHLVYIDFSEVRSRGLLDVVKLLFLSLTDSLRERKLTDDYSVIHEMLTESLSYQDELVLSQGLKRAIEYLSIEKKLTVIFLFDRFEEYIPSVTPEFFADLRLLRNRAKYRFSVVFSLSRPLEEVLEPSLLTDFYEFVAGHRVYVRLYDPVSVDFRIAYLEKITGKRLAKEVVNQVISLTGGHGKLTRIAIEALLANDFVISTTDKEERSLDVTKSQEDFSASTRLRNDKREELAQFLLGQLSIRNGLLEIWRSLTPSEQEYLDTLQNRDPSATPQDDKTNGFDVTNLEKVGLIQDGKLMIPLLASYIDESKRIEETQKAPITYNEATNTIQKGQLTLSDSLTRAEFRLLKYLLSHPDTVVDREDIINVVWKEATSTAGVTDQAVDQLIFRLRRKIEDDPNHPEHLQTVKGRGVRFVS